MVAESGTRTWTQGTTSSSEVSGLSEVDILWISEGMSCDGDTVSITASGQPAIEDVVLGLIPRLPKVNLHNKVLSPSVGGEEFLKPYRAARSEERRVGKECRSRWSPNHEKKKS